MFVVAIDDDMELKKNSAMPFSDVFVCFRFLKKRLIFLLALSRERACVMCVSNDSLSMSSREYKQPFVGMGEKKMIEKKKERETKIIK